MSPAFGGEFFTIGPPGKPHIIMKHLSKLTEHTPPHVNPHGPCGLWVIMMHQYKFLSCNKCTILVGDVDNKMGYACECVGNMWEISVLSSQFCWEPIKEKYNIIALMQSCPLFHIALQFIYTYAYMSFYGVIHIKWTIFTVFVKHILSRTFFTFPSTCNETWEWFYYVILVTQLNLLKHFPLVGNWSF